jgi:predicted DNA-binding mobile mystery protein A
MTFDDLRIRQLDDALRPAQSLRNRPAPEDGWLRTIRQALGMSIRQLGKRAGLSTNAVVSIERNEAKGSVRLESLRRMAQAMDCDLVYAVVPRDSLEEILRRQALRAANEVVTRVAASMDLEDQGTTPEEKGRQVEELAERLRKNRSRIWDV